MNDLQIIYIYACFFKHYNFGALHFNKYYLLLYYYLLKIESTM